jgi:hypothetical protein
MKIPVRFFALVFGLLGFSGGLAAAEAASPLVGKWSAVYETNRGRITATYVIRAEGDKLTGTASSAAFTGEGVLSLIRLEKDVVTFTETFTFDGIGLRFEYTGRLSGDELQLKRVLPAQNLVQEGVAKRVKDDAPAVGEPAVPAK